MSTKRRRFLSALSAIFAVTAFFILSSIAVVWANGLRFNPQTKRFEQTVVVALETKVDRQGVEVFLNGELVAVEIPFQLRGLLPGHYELLVKEEKFQPHAQSFELRAGEVKIIRDYQAIAVSPQITPDSNRVVFPEPAFESGLRMTNDGELLDKNTLVTRFTANPLLVRRFNNGYLYQLGQELRIFLPEGPHDYLLYTFDAPGVGKVNARPSAWELAIEEQGVTKILSLVRPAI